MTVVVAVLLAWLIGFVVGRKSVRITENIRYVKGETITDTIAKEILVPYQVEVPSKPVYIYKTDTLNNLIVEKIDTAKILADWVLNRTYNVTLFDNNDKGKLAIKADVQYNQLSDLNYTYTPITKVVTKQKQDRLQPFASVSYSTLDYVGVGAGLFYRNWGLEYQYQTDITRNSNGHSLGLKYKF